MKQQKQQHLQLKKQQIRQKNGLKLKQEKKTEKTKTNKYLYHKQGCTYGFSTGAALF